MLPLIRQVATTLDPGGLAQRLHHEPGFVLLRGACCAPDMPRSTLVAARPFLTFRSSGCRCELGGNEPVTQFGNPWSILETLLARYELPDRFDFPFPLGGAFGFLGYDLRAFLEPRLARRPRPQLPFPDAWLGFYDSLVVFDHDRGRASIISTGWQTDGRPSPRHATRQADFWENLLAAADQTGPDGCPAPDAAAPAGTYRFVSTMTRSDFLRAVERAQSRIRAGEIYQVNLAHRLSTRRAGSAWPLYRALEQVSPAPFAAFLSGDDFQIASASPELFLRISGSRVVTRPIKGTRPRSVDPALDARLSGELRASPKENAELLMITDLLRNDLGRVCEYGSIRVPELARLERFRHVHHLVSTIEGQLRPGVSHLQAMAACFPGGSVTGAPKIRAMEIIDELEPVPRGPYTGALGYLGFNRESQWNILIRTAVARGSTTTFHVGAGIVADSDPAAEYAETLTKAEGFLAALEILRRTAPSNVARACG